MPNTQDKAESASSGHLLLDLVDKASGNVEGSKGSSLPVFIILISVVVLAFAIMGWVIVQARRKAARLASQLRKKEEELVRITEDCQLREQAEARADAERRAATLQAEIKELKEKLEDSRAAAADQAKMLSQATGWNDLEVVDKRAQ